MFTYMCLNQKCNHLLEIEENKEYHICPICGATMINTNMMA